MAKRSKRYEEVSGKVDREQTLAPAEAVKLVLENDASGSQTEGHQTTMIEEINKLTEGSDGTLDVAAAERTVDTLMKGGSDPVITKKPEGAWTSVVTDAAKAM